MINNCLCWTKILYWPCSTATYVHSFFPISSPIMNSNNKSSPPALQTMLSARDMCCIGRAIWGLPRSLRLELLKKYEMSRSERTSNNQTHLSVLVEYASPFTLKTTQCRNPLVATEEKETSLFNAVRNLTSKLSVDLNTDQLWMSRDKESDSTLVGIQCSVSERFGIKIKF